MIKDKIIEMSIDDIKPYEKNPRFNDHAVEYVKNSIKKFKYTQPIIVDKNNIVIAGHTRLKALKELGYDKVEVIKREDLTDEEAKALRLADNKVAEMAEWDFELLDEELADLDMDMTDFGFEDFEIEDFNEEDLDEEKQKDKVNVSIVIDKYTDYETIKERLENLADEINASLSIKMI